jgi:glycine/D-amino acid oxidase-like deaminating enzyme
MGAGAGRLLPFSGWIEPPEDCAPPLTGETRGDVVIVGGGLTGMAAALRLADLGADVVLLESAFCGWGASSRNAGHLTPTIAGDPQLLATAFRRRAPQLVRLADNAVHFTEGLIERLGLECEYEPVGNVSATLGDGQLRRAAKIAAFLEACGADVELLEGEGSGLPAGFSGGILERVGGVLNPGLFARGLRERLLASGVRLFERSAATSVAEAGAGVSVTTTGGAVLADRALLATNAYARDLRFAPRRVVAPLWVTLAETEPIAPGRLEAAGWTSGSGVYTQHVILESYRPTRRGTIVFGSRLPQVPRGVLGARVPDPSVVADIVAGLHERFPTLRDVAAATAWGGWIAMTPSWLPVAGTSGERIFYALGYNGHGLSQAPYLGTLMAERMSGEEAHDDLLTLWRREPRFLPAPLFSAPALRLGWAIDRVSDRILRRRGD